MTPDAASTLLRWYADSGVLTAESAMPADMAAWPAAGFRALPPSPPPQEAAPQRAMRDDDAPIPTDEAVAMATAAAQAATTLPALVEAITAFDACPLKAGARQTVVYDGVLGAPLLVVGEAPGKEEDRIGKPFVGRAGMLLDRMLAAIGHSRQQGDDLSKVCITNSIYWRPPGNRNPTKAETAICLPFVERFIELSAPKVIILTGNVSTQALFPDAPGITRSHGTWREVQVGGKSFPAIPIFHPAFLLRQPTQKRLAWVDLRAAQQKLQSR